MWRGAEEGERPHYTDVDTVIAVGSSTATNAQTTCGTAVAQNLGLWIK